MADIFQGPDFKKRSYQQQSKNLCKVTASFGWGPLSLSDLGTLRRRSWGTQGSVALFFRTSKIDVDDAWVSFGAPPCAGLPRGAFASDAGSGSCAGGNGSLDNWWQAVPYITQLGVEFMNDRIEP